MVDGGGILETTCSSVPSDLFHIIIFLYFRHPPDIVGEGIASLGCPVVPFVRSDFVIATSNERLEQF